METQTLLPSDPSVPGVPPRSALSSEEEEHGGRAQGTAHARRVPEVTA